MEPNKNTRHLLLVIVLLIGATVTAYWGVWKNDFINYDDPDYVTSNEHVIRGLSWEGVKWAFTTGHSNNWHPVTWLSHMLDITMFGLKPAGHHLTNLAFHIANSVLVLLLLQQITGALWRSAFVAALFALHPLHVESVAWVAERKDVLSTFFGLLTLIAYGGYAKFKDCRTSYPTLSPNEAKRATRVWYGVALILFSLGLMSKPMLVTWPCVMMLLDLWPLARLSLREASDPVRDRLKPLFAEKIPFFVMAAISCGITLFVQQTAMSGADLSFDDRLGNLALTYAEYLKQTIWPANLAIFYPYVSSPSLLKMLGATIGLIVLSLAVFRQRQRMPSLLVGWFWYLGTLVPVIGLVQVGSQARADRYTYVPLIGIFIMFAWGTAFLQSRRPRLMHLFAVGAILIIAASTMMTRNQLKHWRNSETLFEHAAQVTDGNYIALAGLGTVNFRLGRYDQAIQNLTQGLECSPSGKARDQFKYYIGATLQKLGRGLEALPYLEDALTVEQLMPDRDYRLGLSLLEAGRIDEAEVALRKACIAKPDDLDFQLGMAALLVRQDESAKAEAIYRECITRHPDSVLAAKSYADFLTFQHRYVEAETQYATAVKLKPTDPAGLKDYARSLQRNGKNDPAVEHFEEAFKLTQPSTEDLIELADAYTRLDQSEKVLNCYNKAIESNPDSIPVLNNLAWLLSTCPDDSIRNGSRAVNLAERACKVTDWRAAVLIGTLAAAYAEAGRFPDAIAMADKAIGKARDEKQDDVAKRNTELLALYRSGKPYREK